MAGDPILDQSDVDDLVTQVKTSAGIGTAAHDDTIEVMVRSAVEWLTMVTDRDGAVLVADPLGMRTLVLLGAQAWARNSAPLGIAAGINDVPAYTQGGGTGSEISRNVTALRARFGIA